MAAKKNELEKTLDLAGEFVTKHEGKWGHDAWESFLKKADKIGIATDDEGKRNLGNILEASKFLYHRTGIKAEAKAEAKADAKAKAKAKPKATTKKKAAAKKSSK